MRRVLLLTHCVAIAVISVASAPSTVHAEPIEVGVMLGPRLFAEDSILGNTEMAPTSLGNSVLLGVRAARPITPWLVPEVELALSPATTREYDVDVFWFEPRAHMRFQIRPDQRLRPFAVLGGGMPVVLSSRRGIYPAGFTGEAYSGGGLSWNPGRGVALRLDARVSLFQGRGGEKPVTVEGEITAGVWFVLGKKGATRIREEKVRAVAAVTDRDGDGYDDDVDACPDRAEDHDGYEDKDGCPDIDNDGDQVLDVADKCPTVAETYNGFEDDDGCPDTVHSDVDLIVGTVEGLLYSPGEVTVRATANEGLDRIVKVLKDHPSVRLLLVGHTDAKEAADLKPDPDAPPPAEGAEPDAPPDPAELARELGRERAAALRNALMKRGGLTRGRFIIESMGSENPVSDEDSNRGRLRNRRVEVKLFVPKR